MGLQDHTCRNASQWVTVGLQLLALLSFREFRAKMVRLAVHCGMYVRHTEIAKIAFFAVFAVQSWEIPETAARSRSENRHFRPFRRMRHTQIAKIAVRASWGGVVALLVHTQCLGCLHSSNKLDPAIHFCLRVLPCKPDTLRTLCCCSEVDGWQAGWLGDCGENRVPAPPLASGYCC